MTNSRTIITALIAIIFLVLTVRIVYRYERQKKIDEREQLIIKLHKADSLRILAEIKLLASKQNYEKIDSVIRALPPNDVDELISADLRAELIRQQVADSLLRRQREGLKVPVRRSKGKN